MNGRFSCCPYSGVTFEEGLMTSLYRTIVHASGGTYYQGEPITLADAQMMLSNDIAEGKVEVERS